MWRCLTRTGIDRFVKWEEYGWSIWHKIEKKGHSEDISVSELNEVAHVQNHQDHRQHEFEFPENRGEDLGDFATYNK